MNTEHVKRLRDEQDQAIKVSNDQMHKWNKLKTDYEVLSKRLLTLPDKTTHEVMVPIGSKAFMPGQLVHTNEILVLLGDNWFAERSAKQASNIVKRRIKSIDQQIKDLEQQRNLLVNRTGFTDELKQLSEGKDGVVDINEKYEEKKEREWNIQHKENIKKYREKLKEDKMKSEKNKAEDDQAFWDRLEELENQESERNELETEEFFQEAVQEPPSASPEDCNLNAKDAKEAHVRIKKSVHWTDEKKSSSEEDVNSNSDMDDDATECKNEENCLVIKFSHSPVKPKVEKLQFMDTTSEQVKSPICSPSDIYKMFPSEPKSILKSRTADKQSANKEETYSTTGSERTSASEQTNSGSYPAPQAFTSTVIEKSETINQNSTSPDETQQPKRISKFKASRQQR
ncbi:unconventional prefoldin RPB5 interactor isoform X1 [Octopus bimaculoides]|uniref:Uncharacterized protein n=1 Tax=Octopus bimaculoides TaxID=37653 RepID=A0A0L8GTA0_OCTBM|nr:unconventional prefoldin RPB5 interactor isoform X1 [Octopus bimaculoides]XP_014778232.1 unconventional prefoldin RPB5 interactor isoform X1 [Octopus bimaculoides]XP_014778233.1 unconventional prefoldin RPB5 interactor isoform X1 [Octopus bimaculoides]XP_052823355.1 unconventional prefoldin RPB5 interactor isoform X1 [Octopus bimaculoides]XP_052823356.1 unconventional prefoldin RPB5 interactor isoform X1 [Octopus bimaculoides]XP_052823357.1 unconventional prefoldin RPB5 interactor isoform X|eukprot:XP_014778231.1 PREDICTED: unconventional prefoldin RPB5 interactor-like [Octopus bimaculoides]